MEKCKSPDIKPLSWYLNKYRGQYAIHCKTGKEILSVMNRLVGKWYNDYHDDKDLYIYFNANMISETLGKDYNAIEFAELDLFQ